MAQGHSKQYEHLAVSSHEAVKAVQVNAALPVLQPALSLCVLRQQALLHVGSEREATMPNRCCLQPCPDLKLMVRMCSYLVHLPDTGTYRHKGAARQEALMYRYLRMLQVSPFEPPVQSQLEKTKAEYEKRVQTIKQEAEDLRTDDAQDLQATKTELEKAQANAEGSIQQAREEAAQKVREAQVGSATAMPLMPWQHPESEARQALAPIWLSCELVEQHAWTVADPTKSPTCLLSCARTRQCVGMFIRSHAMWGRSVYHRHA